MPPASGLEHGTAAGASNVQNLCRSCGPPPFTGRRDAASGDSLAAARSRRQPFQTPASPLMPADNRLLAAAVAAAAAAACLQVEPPSLLLLEDGRLLAAQRRVKHALVVIARVVRRQLAPLQLHGHDMRLSALPVQQPRTTAWAGWRDVGRLPRRAHAAAPGRPQTLNPKPGNPKPQPT